jgi:exodeoxyribonuclease VII small subunit
MFAGCEKGMVINMKEKENKLEQSFLELNDIIKKLESEDISLEDSFSLYQEGMKLLKSCNESIDRVEKQLIVLGEAKEE